MFNSKLSVFQHWDPTLACLAQVYANYCEDIDSLPKLVNLSSKNDISRVVEIEFDLV